MIVEDLFNVMALGSVAILTLRLGIATVLGGFKIANDLLTESTVISTLVFQLFIISDSTPETLDIITPIVVLVSMFLITVIGGLFIGSMCGVISQLEKEAEYFKNKNKRRRFRSGV